MFAVEITESAESDLGQITDYLGFKLANPQAAASFLDEVARVSEVLTETPELFPLCFDARLAELGYRRATVRAYILVYEGDIDAELVRVLRFFHEFENYANKL